MHWYYSKVLTQELIVSLKSETYNVCIGIKFHNNVIKWNIFRVTGPLWEEFTGHRCRRTLALSLICACTNSWENNRDAGDLRRHCVHYDLTVMCHEINQSRCHSFYKIPCCDGLDLKKRVNFTRLQPSTNQRSDFSMSNRYRTTHIDIMVVLIS